MSKLSPRPENNFDSVLVSAVFLRIFSNFHLETWGRLVTIFDDLVKCSMVALLARDQPVRSQQKNWGAVFAVGKVSKFYLEEIGG